jgi:hypothetical protein
MGNFNFPPPHQAGIFSNKTGRDKKLPSLYGWEPINSHRLSQQNIKVDKECRKWYKRNFRYGSKSKYYQHKRKKDIFPTEKLISCDIVFCGLVTRSLGRAIAQAVSHWLPTPAARVRARVWSCGICGGQSGARTGFLRVLRFPLPIFIPPIAPQSPSSIIWGLYNRPEVAAVPSGLSPTLTNNNTRSVNIVI